MKRENTAGEPRSAMQTVSTEKSSYEEREHRWRTQERNAKCFKRKIDLRRERTPLANPGAQCKLFQQKNRPMKRENAAGEPRSAMQTVSTEKSPYEEREHRWRTQERNANCFIRKIVL